MDFSPLPHPAWLHWLDTCPSTNSWAIAQLSQLPHGDVVFTPHQTAGRGQHGRIWQSPTGVLTASFVLHGIPTAQLSGLSLMAGLAVINAIASCCSELSAILGWKWPNDVLIDGKKLAGILCESVTVSGQSRGSVVIGIGMNRRAEFSPAAVDHDLYHRATNLHDWVQDVPEELLILQQLRHHLLEITSSLSVSDGNSTSGNGLLKVLPDLRQRDVLLGKVIGLELGGKTFSGEAVGISDRGHLRLKLASGEVRTFASGHIKN